MNIPRSGAAWAMSVIATCCIACVAASQAREQAPAGDARASTLPPAVAAGNDAFQKEQWKSAVAHYQQALADGHHSPFIHLRLGYSLHALGRHEEAMRSHLLTAAATHPELRIDGLYNAACASALMGRNDDALTYLEKAIDAGFVDVAQATKDTDLDSLRTDERFKRLVEGIGRVPRLHQQMDFLIGQWTQTDDGGEVVDTLKVFKPLGGSHALVSTSTNIGGGQWTGMLWPDTRTRQWRWTMADGFGTSRELVGSATDDRSMVFRGHDLSPVGPGVEVRLTFTPRQDGSVLERAEVITENGPAHVHHEAAYRRATTAPASSQPAQ